MPRSTADSRCSLTWSHSLRDNQAIVIVSLESSSILKYFYCNLWVSSLVLIQASDFFLPFKLNAFVYFSQLMMFCWLRNAKHVQVISPVSILPAQQHISNFYLGEAFTNALHDIKTLNFSPGLSFYSCSLFTFSSFSILLTWVWQDNCLSIILICNVYIYKYTQSDGLLIFPVWVAANETLGPPPARLVSRLTLSTLLRSSCQLLGSHSSILSSQISMTITYHISISSFPLYSEGGCPYCSVSSIIRIFDGFLATLKCSENSRCRKIGRCFDKICANWK